MMKFQVSLTPAGAGALSRIPPPDISPESHQRIRIGNPQGEKRGRGGEGGCGALQTAECVNLCLSALEPCFEVAASPGGGACGFFGGLSGSALARRIGASSAGARRGQEGEGGGRVSAKAVTAKNLCQHHLYRGRDSGISFFEKGPPCRSAHPSHACRTNTTEYKRCPKLSSGQAAPRSQCVARRQTQGQRLW